MGTVYVISNQSMPGLIKIGYTDGNIQDRLTQLQTTGVPTPFQVEILIQADSAFELEQSLHRVFSSYRHGKEFFRVPVEEVAKAIKDYLIQLGIYEHRCLSGRAHYRYQSQLEVLHIDRTLRAELTQSINLEGVLLKWYDYIESRFETYAANNPDAVRIIFQHVSALIEPFPIPLGPWVFVKNGLICSNTLLYLPMSNITGEFTHIGVLPKTKTFIHLSRQQLPEEFNTISRYKTFEYHRGPAEKILMKSKDDRFPNTFDRLLEIYGGSAERLMADVIECLSGETHLGDRPSLCWRRA